MTQPAFGNNETSPRDDYYYYSGCLLTGVRSDQWKLVLPRVANPPGTGWWGRMIEAIPETQLYHLENDPGETNNIAGEHPAIVRELMTKIESARKELGDMKVVGSGARFFDKGPRIIRGAPGSQPSTPTAEKKYDNFPPAGNLRFSFEDGTIGAWEVVEGEFGQPVTTISALPNSKSPFARHGNYHLSTLMLRNGNSVSDKQTGVLQSPAFKLEGDKAAFLVSGGFDKKSLYVGLIDADSGALLIQAGGSKGHKMKRIVWDVAKWKGRNVRFQVVDKSVKGWGHLNIDDFSVQGSLIR
ncbi:MAG: hypothetical protein P1V20_08250 [Verrucomicrobiales bacterium]|nr:hypothetical protein [Verrucomicrobiales bacterium]